MSVSGILQKVGVNLMNKNEIALKALNNLIGDEKYKAVCDSLAGTRIYIKPYTPYQTIVERNNNIKMDFLDGADLEDLAVKYELSISRIQDIIYQK